MAAAKVKSRMEFNPADPIDFELASPMKGHNKVHPKTGADKIRPISNLIYMYELEIFSFDYAVAKDTELILPFKISLDGQLLESTGLSFDWEKFAVSGGRARKKTSKHTIRPKLGLITPGMSPIQPRSNSHLSQSYTLKHTLEFYYLTNSGYKNYTKETSPTAAGIFGGLKDFFSGASDFMSARSEFQVCPHLKWLRQFNPITQDMLAQKFSKSLLCFKWGEPIRCRIHIDKTRLGPEDSGVTLLFHFKRCMLMTFRYLECVLYCKLERKITLENPGSSSHILLRHSFNLNAGLPPRSSTAIEEFVKFVELRTPLAKSISINGPSCSITFYLKIFVSKNPGLYQNELLNQEISFTFVDSDVQIPSTRFQTEAFKKVEKMVESVNSKRSTRMMSLPFSEVSLSKPSNLYEEEVEDDPN